MKKIKLNVQGNLCASGGKNRADYKVAIEMAFEKLGFFFYLNQGGKRER